jgi:uncharacterized cupredoxin-like copper-binding protein
MITTRAASCASPFEYRGALQRDDDPVILRAIARFGIRYSRQAIEEVGGMRPTNKRSGAVVALAAICAGVGCGGDDGASPAAKSDKPAATEPAQTSRPQLTLGDFSISPATIGVGAGTVTIAGANRGTVEHEVLVVRTDLDPASLPVKGDKVDEDGLEKGAFIGEIEGIKPGDSGQASFKLKAGKHVVFCNLPGHYKAGMYGTLVVE